MVNSYFNIFPTRKISSQRAQNKIATNQQNNVALEAINKIDAFKKNMIQKKKEKEISSFFFNEKVNLQEKINALDGKIQDVQKDLNFFMDYKNDLLIEMNDLIVDYLKSILKNPSTPAHASKELSTQTSTYVVNQVYTQKSIQESSSNTNYTLNVITPPSTRSK